MSESRCKCPMAISLTGDGCRYCQAQEHIDRLGEWLDEERADKERLVRALSEAADMLQIACEWTAEQNARTILQELEGEL